MHLLLDLQQGVRSWVSLLTLPSTYRADLFGASRTPRTAHLGLKVIKKNVVLVLTQVIEEFLFKICQTKRAKTRTREILTNNVIAKLIADQGVHQRLVLTARSRYKRLKNTSAPVVGRELDALFNDITGVSVAAIHLQVVLNGAQYKLSIFVRAFFDNMLYHVVAILLRDQIFNAVFQLVHHSSLVRRWAMFKTSLDDATSESVAAESEDLSFESMDYESDCWKWAVDDGHLNDMITVVIVNAFDDVVLEFRDEIGLLVCEDVLQSLLYNAAAIRRLGQLQDLPLHLSS